MELFRVPGGHGDVQADAANRLTRDQPSPSPTPTTIAIGLPLSSWFIASSWIVVPADEPIPLHEASGGPSKRERIDRAGRFPLLEPDYVPTGGAK